MMIKQFTKKNFNNSQKAFASVSKPYAHRKIYQEQKFQAKESVKVEWTPDQDDFKSGLFPNLPEGQYPNPERPKALWNHSRYISKKKPFPMKKQMTEEEKTNYVDQTITKMRQGTTHFDGGNNEGLTDYYRRVENIVPKAFNYMERKENKDKSGWLFHGAPASLNQKPTTAFERSYFAGYFFKI